jgi:hypothetical protein
MPGGTKTFSPLYYLCIGPLLGSFGMVGGAADADSLTGFEVPIDLQQMFLFREHFILLGHGWCILFSK